MKILDWEQKEFNFLLWYDELYYSLNIVCSKFKTIVINILILARKKAQNISLLIF